MQQQQKKRLIKWISLLVFNLLFATLILLIQDDYSTRGFSNAAFIPGIVTFFLLLLKLITDAGTFDLTSYSFSRIRHSIRQQDLAQIPSAHEYIDKKKIERKLKGRYYLPDIVISLLFILIGAILTFVK